MVQREKLTVSDPLRRLLRADGWLVEKSHGNLYQAGWPDLYCFHLAHGHRWVETKTPNGRLTPAQFETFSRWVEAGVPIWILTEPRPDLLLDPPNARAWLDRYRPAERRTVGRYFESA